METTNDLKAAVYDRLAQIQQYEQAITQVREQIGKLNAKIAESLKKDEEIIIKESKKKETSKETQGK